MVTQTSVFSSAALRTSDRCPLCSAPMVGTRPTVRWFSRSSRLYFRSGAISWKTCVRSLTAKALRRDAVDDKQRMPFWMPLWRTGARRTGAKLLSRPVRAVKTRVHLLGYRLPETLRWWELVPAAVRRWAMRTGAGVGGRPEPELLLSCVQDGRRQSQPGVCSFAAMK